MICRCIQALRTTLPSPRPGDGTSEEAAVFDPLQTSPIPYAAGTALLLRNSVASTHMRWRTTPSLRAKATFTRFMPRSLCDGERPAFQARKANRSRQHDMGRFKKRGSHHTVADLADAAVTVGLARLVFFGVSPK